MNYDSTLLNYFVHASLVVKCVMLILAVASIYSWAYILQRLFYLKDIKKSAGKFENSFWSGEDLSKLYVAESRNNQSWREWKPFFMPASRNFSAFANSLAQPTN